ncbi:MAG: hypothetical protein WCG95_03370 [bacterium]
MTDAIQNSVNIQTRQGNENPQAMLGIACGAGAGLVLRKGVDQLKKPYFKLFLENADKFTPQEQEALTKEANRMIEESGIAEKGFNGVNWIDASKKSTVKSIKEIIDSKLKEFKISKYLTKSISEQTLENLEKLDPTHSVSTGKITTDEAAKKLIGGILKTAVKGSLKDKLTLCFMLVTAPISKLANILTGQFKNKDVNELLKSITLGAFDPFSNRIFTSKPASVLHEIGHAINKNTNFFTKIPNNLSLISKGALIPLAILTAIFTKKPKNPDAEQTTNKSSFEKLKEFVHNHIGLTVAGLSLPLLVEEGLASTRAVKFVNASKVLSETTKNQHNKVLKIAYGSYLIGTAVLASGASLAVFVKDKIVEYTTKN